MSESPKILDIGCGSDKYPGAFGIDIYPYEGVDQVVNVNEYPWELADNSFDKVVCSHIIEHIDDMTAFLREIHRITKPSGKVYIETPHFSSICSWSDPTHKAHLSSNWYEVATKDGYLSSQTGTFELISSEVTFGKSLRYWWPKLLIRLRGTFYWEKKYAFIYPARDIKTWLTVKK